MMAQSIFSVAASCRASLMVDAGATRAARRCLGSGSGSMPHVTSVPPAGADSAPKRLEESISFWTPTARTKAAAAGPGRTGSP